MVPTISVIMPAYNVQDYIAESIKSIQQQTYLNWELIIVNDGSTDKTLEVATSFNDSRIKIINQNNQGVSAARNTGILSALGNYISFLDGDDLWLPNFLETMFYQISQSKSPFIIGGYCKFFESGKIEHFNVTPIKENIIWSVIMRETPCHINSILLDKDILLKTNIQFTPGFIFYEDFEFIIKILCVSPVSFVPKELMKYRQRKGSAIHTTHEDKKTLCDIQQTKRTIRFIKTHYIGQDKKDLLEKFSNYFSNLCYKSVLKFIRSEKYDLAKEILNNHQFKLQFTHAKLKDLIRIPLLKSKSKFVWKIFINYPPILHNIKHMFKQ